MRVVLINPRQNVKYPQPSLGLLSLGTICKRTGHGVKILDANVNHYSVANIVKEVELYDIVGITAMSLSYPEAEKIARAIRKEYPYKFMVIGGVHATTATREILNTNIFNAIVVGEGETAFSNVLEKWESAVYWGTTERLNELPMLDYGLLGGKFPKMSYGKHRHFMPILTSRGCPYHCSFCSKGVFKEYRVRDSELVGKEINSLINDYKLKEIKIYDDVFTLDKGRAVEISARIGGRVDWTCMTRVNLVDRFTLWSMKKNGCYSVAYGIESGDSDILKSVSKNISLAQVEQAVKYSKEVGLRVIGYFMLGSPGETETTIEKTVDFAIKLGIDYAQFSIATALPGSELYQKVPEALRANSYATKGVDNPSLCVLTPKQLKQAVKQAEYRFKRGK